MRGRTNREGGWLNRASRVRVFKRYNGYNPGHELLRIFKNQKVSVRIPSLKRERGFCLGLQYDVTLNNFSTL